MIVEAALVLPLLLALLLGFVEFSLVEFQQGQASSAARDGARVGILGYREADIVGSADNDAIVAAVNARLAGQDNVSVDVRCLTTAGAAAACSTVPITGSIEVAVSWPHTDLTFFGPLVPSTIESTSTMTLVGGPVTVTPTTSTTASTSTTTPASTTTSTAPPSTGCQLSTNLVPTITGAAAKSNGQLRSAMTIADIVTNGDGSCGIPKIRIFYTADGTNPPSLTQQLNPQSTPNTYAYTWSANHKPSQGNAPGWTPGVVQFQVLTGTDVVIGQYQFTMGSN
ncbi:TadE/TadG family type IV pilus assembly protein [Rhabdothermincola salaria]|uniref:TadE/TadG family type IV pilus assembly protein n=1 Tax=Rhabdothermincola salaria TaxID=2903142 RepID=UPI001E2C553E|nr:pilus assembly protein [Rhabdothermincola salaria]